MAATFAVHAVVSGSWAPRLPSIKSDLGLDAGDLGIALAGFAAGLVLGTRIAGRVVDRYGARRPIRLGLLVLFGSLLGPALATDLTTLVAAFALFGALGGFLDVSMNANAVAVEREHGRPIMSGLHGLWSVGLLVGSGVGTAAAALGAGVTLHFAIVAIVLAIVAPIATRGLIDFSDDAQKGAIESAERLQRRATVLVLGLIAFASFASEGAVADWSAVYLHERVGVATGSAGLAFVAFSLGMIVARFASDRLTMRVGPVRVARAGAVVASVGMTLGLAVPSAALVVAGYLLVGIGLAPIVPIAFSAAGNVDPGRAGASLSAVVAIGYLGSVLAPIAIGFLADSFGLRAALTLPVVLALLAAALASALSPT